MIKTRICFDVFDGDSPFTSRLVSSLGYQKKIVESIEVEESDDLAKIFSFLTCLHEKLTVMKRKADYLLYL